MAINALSEEIYLQAAARVRFVTDGEPLPAPQLVLIRLLLVWRLICRTGKTRRQPGLLAILAVKWRWRRAMRVCCRLVRMAVVNDHVE